MDWGRGSCGGCLLVLLLLFHHRNLVAAGEWDTIGKTLCVHVGQRPWDHFSGYESAAIRQYSIGGHLFFPEGEHALRFYIAWFTPESIYAQEFDNTLGFKDNTCKDGAWTYREQPYKDLLRMGLDHVCYTDPRLDVRLNLVRQGDKTLRGWLHVEVEFKPQELDDELEWVYVQFLDEEFNAVGEFVAEKKDQCKSSNKELIEPNKFQYMPCHAIGYRESKVSGAIFVARKSALNDPSLVQTDIKRGIHVTWRLGEYSCNRHKRIRIETIVFTKSAMKPLRDWIASWNDKGGDDALGWGKQGVRMSDYCGKLMKKCRGIRHITSHWLVPERDTWTGTPDIKSGDKELVCTIPAISNREGKGQLAPEASNWLSSTEPNTFKTDFEFSGTDLTKTSIKCLQDIHPSNPPEKQMRTFSGRCGKPGTEYSFTDKLQNCTPIPGSDKNLEKYTDYTTTLQQKRVATCPKDKDRDPCTFPDSSDPKKTQTFIEAVNKSAPYKRPAVSEDGRRKISVRFGILIESRKIERWNSLAQTRKYHGNLCILVALFLIPVSNFLARYYKETFVNGLHPNQPCTPWLAFHLTSWFFVLCPIRSGYTAMRSPMEAWGTSTSGASSFHYYFGYIFIILFTLMGLLGAVRPKEPKLRIAVMMVHSVLGFFLNWASLALVVQSSWIPASPSIDECDKGTGETPGFSHVGLIAVLWGVIDLGFHIALTTIQIVLDRREQLKRPGMGIIFPPMYAEEKRFDFIGAKLRKLLLLIYLGLSITLTLYSMAYLLGKETDEGCTLGNMTCDLEVDHFGCSPIAKKYLTIVNEKYHVEK